MNLYRLFILIILVTLFSKLSAQNYMVDVAPAYGKPIAIKSIQNPDNLDDLIPYYPHSWIEGYNNVEISVNHQGIPLNENGQDATLNEKQTKLLQEISVGDYLCIAVNYYSINGITGEKVNSKMEVKYLIVPDVQASYAEGEKALRSLFYSLIVDEINEKEIIVDASVHFVVDESGSVNNVKLTKSSGDQSTDELILKSIAKMATWNPAKDESGKKYKQEFVLRIFNGGC